MTGGGTVGDFELGTADPVTGDNATITIVNVTAFEYTDPFDGTLTTTQLNATDDGVVTNIGSSNSLGVNHPSFSNGGFETAKGDTSGTEGSDFNPGEAVVFEFDEDLVFTEFNFTSIDATDEFFDIFVDGILIDSFSDGTADDDFVNPLGSLVISAGSDVTFAARGPGASTNIRITSISAVLAIPEPGSIAMLGVSSMLMMVRRRRLV